MTNTLYLPELREMLAEHNAPELHEFCCALHPARTAEFMEGLTTEETWQVLQHADEATRGEIFGYFDSDKQVAIIEAMDRPAIGQLIATLPADDQVDVLQRVAPSVVEELMPLLPTEVRRNILRLQSYPEGTAGAVMTTECARLTEDLNVREAIEEVRRQAERMETIYYLYVVDHEDHLRGLVSLRQLVLARSDATIGDLMERAVVTVHVAADQEEVARTLAKFDFLAVPIVDSERHLLGIVTHDDVIDVVREEAAEDAHRLAAVDPLTEGYLETPLLTLTWKRGMWLAMLFVGSLLTAVVLSHHEASLREVPWLLLFIPLVLSTGGNTGSQAATLVITALSSGDVRLADWWRIIRREILMGLLLGGFLGSLGYLIAFMRAPTPYSAFVIPLTLILVVTCGTLVGSILPLIFRRLGLDPALMSNPFVASISDVTGIMIYMTVAMRLLGQAVAGG